MDLWINYLDQIFLYATLALSLNLLLGYAGQVSVAHASFGAIGGYAMGYLSQHNHWNFLLGTLVGMVLAFVIGSIVALPALKLTVEYLILLTLAVSSVILGLLIATRFHGRHVRPDQPAPPRPVRLAHQRSTRLGDPVTRRDAARLRHLPSHRRITDGPGVEGHPRGPHLDPGPGQERLRLQGRDLRHHLGTRRVRRLDAVGVVAAGHTGLVRLLVLADHLRDRHLRWHGQPERHHLRRSRRGAARAGAPSTDQDGGQPRQRRAVDHLRPGAGGADAGAPAGCIARGLLTVALDPRRTWSSRSRRDGRGLGAAGQHRRPRARRRRVGTQRRRDGRRVRATTRALVAGSADRARDRGSRQTIRRHHRRQRSAHPVAQGHDHRLGRSQWCREDHGVQPAHRLHPARRRLGEVERRRAGRADPQPGRAQGARQVVPGRAVVQPALVPAERDDGGAAPSG